MSEIVVPINHLLWMEVHLGDVLLETGLCTSKTDMRRVFEQNGIRVNGDRSQDRLLFLNDLRHRPGGGLVIMLRRGQRTFSWLEFTEYETTGAYAQTPVGFFKSGEIGGGEEAEGWATREWGLWPGAIDGPWRHRVT